MRTLLLRLGLVLGLSIAARSASAGACINDVENDQAMEEIEAFAKDAKSGLDAGSLSWECAEIDAIRLRPRIERACRVILDRDEARDGDRDGRQSPCARLAAIAGFAKLGRHAFYDLVVKLPEDPLRWESVQGFPRVLILGRIGDPRGAAVILQTWRAALPRAAKDEGRRDRMQAWSLWRQRAAAALGALGGRDEAAFLDEQARATRDTHVAKACRGAIAAIDRRVGAAALPGPSPAPAPGPSPAPAPARTP